MVILTPPAAKPTASPAEHHHAGSPPPDAKPRPAPGHSPRLDKGKVATLMDTKLGDVLLAAVLKDPASAGHFITAAIDDAESSETGPELPANKATITAAPNPKAAE